MCYIILCNLKYYIYIYTLYIYNISSYLSFDFMSCEFDFIHDFKSWKFDADTDTDAAN